MEKQANKVLLLGIDGMDPRLSLYHMEQGHMPNLQKLIERGSAREDLILLGALPTITPPMWTTLATGAYPATHGIPDFWRQHPQKLDTICYNLDSRLCQAEQLWNVTAEAGRKTLVWHWPGSSWPPTSDSPNLHVVDGTQPEAVCQGTGEVDGEFIAGAKEDIQEVTFKAKAGGGDLMCVITDLDMGEKQETQQKINQETGCDTSVANAPEMSKVFITGAETVNMSVTNFDYSISTLKPASKWLDVPSDAKEFVILFSKGLIRRPALLLKNEEGIYDTVAIYKNKKAAEPIIVLKKNELTTNVIDEAIKNDQVYLTHRVMRVLDIAQDGSFVKIYISAAVNIDDDSVFHPRSLHQQICTNVGYPLPVSNAGAADPQLVMDCMGALWWESVKWQANSLNYLIEENGYEVVFSQIHNDDAQKHMYLKYVGGKIEAPLPVAFYQEALLDISRQNDYYIGQFLPLLDKGWTIFLISDHGLVCPEIKRSPFLGNFMGVNGTQMVEWGYTALKHDDNGKALPEIDWTQTKAIWSRCSMIYINEKGRWPNGIVEPEDKYRLEEEIMTKLYEQKDEQGNRLISLALRNKDALLLGMGGPEFGDIIVMHAEQHNADHGDSLSTFIGAAHTSVSPIFVAAGAGIKENFKTTRVIREVDVAPTAAALLGVRMPAQCEGAPVYQIFTA